MSEESLKKVVDELKKKLEEVEKLKNEYLAGWQRVRADLINYKKEEAERMEELLKYVSEGLILKFLPILDNFEIAEKKLPEDLKKNENVKGLLQIKNQIKEFLKNQGLEEIEVVGKKFDPAICEVVGEIETTEKETGIVLEEIQKGYNIKGKLLRAAKVKVAK